MELLSCTIKRKQKHTHNQAIVIEGPSQEIVDDPTKFNHQPSNGKRNHRVEQEFLYQLKMKITEYMLTVFFTTHYVFI